MKNLGSCALFAFLLGILLSGCVFRNSLYRKPAPDAVQVEQYRMALEGEKAPGKLFMPTPRPALLPAPRLVYTPEVQRELTRFRGKEKAFVTRGFARRRKYDSVLRQIFQDEGVPPRLLNLALIESGFQPDVKSYAGAAGMWQFMKRTAQVYGLQVGVTQDQRKDPILSTIAAARHLRDLYIQYKDWWLALAAYNAGTGRVNRAIRGVGSRDFFKISRKGKLPLQTRRYVPRFIAIALIEKHPEKYGFSSALTGVSAESSKQQ